MLNILQARCEELGVKLVFETQVTDDTAYDADLIVACDGANSAIRQKYAATYKPAIDMRDCRFVWLGTDKLFDAFTFAFEETEFGWFQAHAYRFDDQTSTFIVETPEHVWRAAGLDEMSKEDSIAFCEKLFAKYLDGNPLLSNATHLRGSSQWIRFPRVVNEEWVHWRDNARRQPDAYRADGRRRAHRAFLDRLGHQARARRLDRTGEQHAAHPGDLAAALKHYTDVRSIDVLRIQNAARNSTEWFEHVDRYTSFEPEQFAYSLLTRSQRISHENLRERDASYLSSFEDWLRHRSGVERAPEKHSVPPMFTPFTLRGVTLEEPRRRLADGAVLRRKRHCRRLSPDASRRTRDGRRRACHDGDDLRIARSAHHAGVSRHVRH